MLFIFLALLHLFKGNVNKNINSHSIVVQANTIGFKIQPTMFGIFFEDINFGADAGLYAELVKNRAFQYPQNLRGWVVFGNVTLMNDGPFENNSHYVRLGYSGHREKRTGIENEGYFGIGVCEGCQYRFTVWARTSNTQPQRITVQLIKNDSMDKQEFESQDLFINTTNWTKYELILTSTKTEDKAHLRIYLFSSGEVDLTFVSLFPVNTFKKRLNGLREDLAQALFDLKPGVFRFPGGCVVEGTDEKTRYQWKNTVGKLEERPLNENRWHSWSTSRLFPDYYQTGGLGFYEYFQLAEDIGAEPLPVLNSGLICQFQNDDDQQIPLNMISQFVQDSLDLIEFANGDNNTKWGRLRIEMGHEKPFNLKYIAIGNEQWGVIFPERFERFVTAIRNQYPDIKIVGTAGASLDDSMYDYMWREMRLLKPDLVDEHYYMNEEWFLSNADRYDRYDRNSLNVFVGEFACHGAGRQFNHFNASLMEAAFMTGLERNADIVHMATYAPLFAHIKGYQWRPDLIWFDNLRIVKTCSYYVQKLFSVNKGTNFVNLTMNGKPVCGKEGQDGLYASSVWDENDKSFIVKIVNTENVSHFVSVLFDGLDESVKLTKGKRTTFHSDDLLDENTLDDPYRIIPIEKPIEIEGHVLNTEINAKTFAVFRFVKEDIIKNDEI